MKNLINNFLLILFVLGLMGILFFCNKNNEANYDIAENIEDEICEISIENVTLGAVYPDTESVEKRINELTIPLIGCKVKIVNCYIGEHRSMVHMASAGTKKMDIINTGLTTSLPELVSEGALKPLNKLLEFSGSAILEKEGDLLKATTIDGEIYAISSNLYPGRASGIGYNVSIANKYNINMPGNLTMTDLTDIGEKLHKADSLVYLTTQGNGALTAFDSFYDIEDFGGDLNYGIIFNPLENTDITDAYASEEYKNYCLTLKDWREKGYIPADSLINGQDAQEMFNNGEIFFQWSSVSPQTEYLIGKKNLGFKEELVALTPNRISTSGLQEFAWGISSSCENPGKAMELLNLIFSNAQIANLFQNGRENIDYVKTGDMSIEYADGLDNNSVGYGSYFSIFGDTAQLYHFGADVSFDVIEDYSENSFFGKTMGYVFHTESVAAEIAAVSQISREYRPILETGMADNVEQTLADFQADLESAGIKKIISENQRQLKLWMELE